MSGTLPIDLKNTVLTINDFKKKLRKNMNDKNSIILSHLKVKCNAQNDFA